MYKRYWVVKFWTHGFEGQMLVYGTEEELWEYLNSEIGGGDCRTTGNYSYHGASQAEYEAAQVLRMKAYLCPEIKRK